MCGYDYYTSPVDSNGEHTQRGLRTPSSARVLAEPPAHQRPRSGLDRRVKRLVVAEAERRHRCGTLCCSEDGSLGVPFQAVPPSHLAGIGRRYHRLLSPGYKTRRGGVADQAVPSGMSWLSVVVVVVLFLGGGQGYCRLLGLLLAW